MTICVILVCWLAVLAELPTKLEPPTDCIRPGLSGCEGSGFVDAHTFTQPEDCKRREQKKLALPHKPGLKSLLNLNYTHLLHDCSKDKSMIDQRRLSNLLNGIPDQADLLIAIAIARRTGSVRA